MDSFSILGIAPDASAAEIKRAYRRMAMAWHPDRSSHPEATERFKQIRAAYEALLSREVREEEASETESDAAQPGKAADIRLDLEISLEEAADGCDREIILERGVACATCKGSGEAGMSRSRPCQSCHGSGRIRDRYRGLELCEQCGGRGYLSQRICPECSGKGKHDDRVSLHVTVPAGMLPGDELRLAGQGEPGLGDQARGDLFLKLSIRRHALFELNGRDLSYSMPVNALKLLAGGKIELRGLAGIEMLKLEAGTIGERTVRLAGRGYPGRRSEAPGDLVVHLEPFMPRNLNPEQARLLQQAANACEENLDECLPEIAVWRRRYGV